MGGRGASSRFEERKKRITEINKSIKSLKSQIAKHEEKIRAYKESEDYMKTPKNERQGLIHHWEKEIEVFKDNIEKEIAEKKRIKKGER